jgi:hypothetical protein
MWGIRVATVVSLVLTLNSCGADPGQKNSEFNLKIRGNWASPCVSKPSDFGASDMEGHAYVVRNIAFGSETEFSYTEIHYGSDACEAGDEVVTLDGGGTFELGDDIGREGAKHLTFSYDKFSAIVKGADLAAELTDAKYCDVTTWRVDDSVSLFGKTCRDETGSSAQFPGTGVLYSDAVDVEANSLWLGKKTSPIGTDKADAIDTALTYTRL